MNSSTLMNKVFEVIETKIFNINYYKIKIIIHRESYIHSIIQFQNGMIKLIAHDTTMEIPIANTLYNNNYIFKKNISINIKKLNILRFQNVNYKKFPLVNILNDLPKNDSLYETILVSANDELVDLLEKIKYNEIKSKLMKILEKRV